MKLALVFDAPRSGGASAMSGVSGTYLERLLDACADAAGVGFDAKVFTAVSQPVPGGKAAPIAAVREERGRLELELAEWGPDRILSLGASALNALTDAPKALAISKERGRMRYSRSGVPWLPTITPLAAVKRPDLHRDIAYDVYKVLTQAAPLEPIDVQIMVCDTLDELVAALGYLEDATVVGVDVETTGLSAYRDNLLALGIGAVDPTGELGVAVIVTRNLLSDPESHDYVWDAVWRKSRRAVGHNFKFDMQFLERAVGWPPPGALVGDSLLMAYLLDERPNRPDSRVRGLGLKDLVAVRYDHQYGFDFAEFYELPEGERDYDAMHVYLADDVCYTARLWHDLAAEAAEESERLLACHDELLIPAAATIARCERGGAPIDVPWVRQQVATLDARIARRRADLEARLTVLTGRKVDNVLSPTQIADVMYDDWGMTPDVRKHGSFVADDRSTDKDHVKAAVARYKDTDLDAEARWLEELELLRRDSKTRTTYQKSYLDKVDEDGRVRASFLLHGTSTGRLSSQGPNLQNVAAVDREDSDKEAPMRRAFRPAHGWQWVEVDYSQLELRVAAGLSGDQAFGDVFRSGRDVHLEVATAIFSKPPEQISKAERFLAKAVGFGIIYGRGPQALATGVEMRYVERELGGKAWTTEQARAFISKFLRSYPDLALWIEKLHREVPAQGYVETPFGRRRRFPLTPRNKGEVNSIKRQAVNTPVQSVASDICLQAMTRVERAVEWHEVRARVLFPVHDSICLEVAPDDVENLEKLCRREMEVDFMGVPLTVDFEHGPTWADVGKE